MNLSLDFHTAIQTALVITLVALVITLWQGIRSLRAARRLPFFRMRRERILHGWRLFFWSLLFGALAYFLYRPAEPLIYRYFPATATPTLTPTVTLTPTITLSPTVSLTPTITRTPSVTDTPTITFTPNIPLAVEMAFISTITPNPDAIFSSLTFTTGLDSSYRPLNPGVLFKNPVGHMYAMFSYDQMVNGAQWTALWYRNGALVNYESKPWDGGSGGLGYTDWAPKPEEWLPGEYQVQIFVGLVWKISGVFTVEGEAPTAEPTATASPTPTPSRTPIPSWTPRPSLTPTNTRTITPTKTPYVSPTRTSTRTPWPTLTRTPVTPSSTPWPTRTRTPTPSH